MHDRGSGTKAIVSRRAISIKRTSNNIFTKWSAPILVTRDSLDSCKPGLRMISDMWWKSSNLRKKIEKVLKELFHKEMTCKIFRIITAPYLTEPYTNAKIEKNHEQWIIPSNSTPAYLAIISLVRQGFLIFSIDSSPCFDISNSTRA